MNALSQVPPGFRFHPTDEELVDHYLRRKVSCRQLDIDVIKDVDLYKIEPWDLQELCRTGIGTEEQNEWYFFSHKDKKYPTGTRTNRATAAGFWKATGRDKAIYSKHDLIGMRKTLVFYRGRAPNGQKSDWIMHEYRLEADEKRAPQEEGWVVCRVFKKRTAAMRKCSEHDSPLWYDDHVFFMDSPRQTSQTNAVYHSISYKGELDSLQQYSGNANGLELDHFIQLPLLENPKMRTPPGVNCTSVPCMEMISATSSRFRVITSVSTKNKDWRVLDKFVASQLSHDHVAKGNEVFDVVNELNLVHGNMKNQQVSMDTASTSSSFHQVHHLWKSS